MVEDVKAKVLEIVEITKTCPEALQEKCFELLLTDYLESRRGTQLGRRLPAPPKAPGEQVAPSPEVEGAADSGAEQSDIQDNDLHVKARRFLQKHSLSVDDLNQLLYKEDDAFLPLYEDLKTTRAAESQIRIALLQALISGLQSGNFEFSGERVRQECQQRKCYDGNNFTANFRNNATLFEGFDKYDKKSPIIRLSENGRKELAEVIRELQ